MENRSNDFPCYYDGYSHVELSEEIQAEAKIPKEDTQFSSDEWRRFISANPYPSS
jgi:hypothetical protein